jgi:hypothetical protein
MPAPAGDIRAPDMKPGSHGVRTPWKSIFIAFRDRGRLNGRVRISE